MENDEEQENLLGWYSTPVYLCISSTCCVQGLVERLDIYL